MNYPAIAKETYEKYRKDQAFLNITQFIIDHLKKMTTSIERARFVHDIVDDCNQEIFKQPIIKKLLPCSSGCAGCCYSQVGITEDEADLLADRIASGVTIDKQLLKKQMDVGNKPKDFYRLSYEDRKCIFLDNENNCKVYEDRPSVCRTNAVLGDVRQCYSKNDESESQKINLLKTERADMAIMGSFFMSKENGTMAFMLGKIFFPNKKSESLKKSIFTDKEL